MKGARTLDISSVTPVHEMKIWTSWSPSESLRCRPACFAAIRRFLASSRAFAAASDEVDFDDFLDDAAVAPWSPVLDRKPTENRKINEIY